MFRKTSTILRGIEELSVVPCPPIVWLDRNCGIMPASGYWFVSDKVGNLFSTRQKPVKYFDGLGNLNITVTGKLLAKQAFSLSLYVSQPFDSNLLSIGMRQTGILNIRTEGNNLVFENSVNKVSFGLLGSSCFFGMVKNGISLTFYIDGKRVRDAVFSDYFVSGQEDVISLTLNQEGGRLDDFLIFEQVLSDAEMAACARLSLKSSKGKTSYGQRLAFSSLRELRS